MARRSLTRDIFVPVRLGQVLEGIAGGESDPVSAAVVTELNPEGLRPSIETTLHALLPHQVVVHTHSVRTAPWPSAPMPKRSLPGVSTASTGSTCHTGSPACRSRR
jgi:rhamnose utilization protein RhaD (predicted bifunctional aldolase and dehydrogenase)